MSDLKEDEMDDKKKKALQLLLKAEKEINGLGFTISFDRSDSISIFGVKNKDSKDWEDLEESIK